MKFYGNELSLVVCFTRITVNVPRIVINCFGLLHQGGMVPTAMSCQRGLVRWLASVVSCPFVLKQKDQKFKADIMGPPHLATAPPPCRPGPRARPGWSLAFPHTRSVVVASFLNGTPSPLAVIAGPDPRSPKRQGDTSILLQINETTNVLQQVYAP